MSSTGFFVGMAFHHKDSIRVKPTKEEWIELMGPGPLFRMRDVKDRLSNHPSLVDWIPRASYEAVSGLEMMSADQMAMVAYGNLLDDLVSEYPDLLAAVEELTGGCGRLAMHWRPVSPQFTTVYIDFNFGYDVALLCRIKEDVTAAVSAFLVSMADMMPAGEPFPGRPYEVAGLITEGRGPCVQLRYVLERKREGLQRYAIVGMRGNEKDRRIPTFEALDAILDLLNQA